VTPIAELAALVERRCPAPMRRALEAAHPHQRAVLDSRASRLALCCSRRAGKSHAIVLWLLQAAIAVPRSVVVYVGVTRGLARAIVVPVLDQLRAQHGLEWSLRTEDGQVYALVGDGSRLWIAGCETAVDAERFRGRKYRRVAWDEAQVAGAWLRQALDDAIDPALLDLRGELLLAGTPGAVPVGYYHDVCVGDAPGWEVHGWDLRSNPYLGDVTEYLERKRRELRWTEDHPTYRREYLGQWVRDTESLVYDWQYARNWGEPPETGGRRVTVIGVDLGASGTSAWAVLQWVAPHPEVYVVEVDARDGQIPSAVAARTQALAARYPGARIVVDAGGLGGAYVEEMRIRYGVAAEAAQKSQRRAAIEVLRGDVLAGTLRTGPQCRALVDEWSVLQWRDDRSDYDPRYPDHITDAVTYAHRAIRPRYQPQPDEPERDHWGRLEDETRRRHRAAAEKRAKEQQRRRYL